MALIFEFDFDVAKAALLYLASKGLPNFDKYRAVKLLFLADREHLLRFGRPITGDDYNALPYGPTGDRILNLLGGMEEVAIQGADPKSDEVAELSRCFEVKDLAHPTYHALVEPDFDLLSKTDLMALDAAISGYGHKTFDELYHLTHSLKVYDSAWHPGQQRKKFPMPYASFFWDTPDRSDFLKGLEEDQLIMQKFSQSVNLPKVMSA